jgi:hypothetical protein
MQSAYLRKTNWFSFQSESEMRFTSVNTCAEGRSDAVPGRPAQVCKFNEKFWEELIPYFPLIRHRSHRKRRVQQSFQCCECFQCRGNVFSDPLNCNIDIETQRHTGGTEMGSGGTIYTPSFIKTGSGMERGIHRHTDRKSTIGK